MYVFDRTFRFIAGAILAAFVMAAVNMSAANAQQSQTDTVSAFLFNPGQLLQQYPNGGLLLTQAVQKLAISDPSTFKVLLGLLANANDLQKGAIGTGLAQAAKVEVLTNQALAADWQQQIAAITDPAFKTAATNAFGDVKLGAVGGGAAGAAGGNSGGPSTGSASGGPERIGGNGVPTNPFIFSGGVTGAGGPNQGSSGNAPGPMSPH
jgi:hypothetical protein